MVKDNELKLTDKKFVVPQVPKTETRIILNDWSQEVKNSPLSPAARAKVINRSGSNYLSESKEGYGPCSYYGCNHRDKSFDMDISIQGCKWWARNPNCGSSLPGMLNLKPNQFLFISG